MRAQLRKNERRRGTINPGPPRPAVTPVVLIVLQAAYSMSQSRVARRIAFFIPALDPLRRVRPTLLGPEIQDKLPLEVCWAEDLVPTSRIEAQMRDRLDIHGLVGGDDLPVVVVLSHSGVRAGHPRSTLVVDASL